MKPFHATLLLLSLTMPCMPAMAKPPADDGWPTVPAACAGWDPAQLAEVAAKVEDGTYPATTSVLVVDDGRLVHEAYYGEGDRERLNDTRSATKTVTAMLVGAAVGQGLIPGVDAHVYETFPDAAVLAEGDPVRAAIRIEDLLTMSSMWECDDENNWSAGNEERMYLSRDWSRFALTLPIKGFAPWMRRPQDSPHGRAFSYCTAGAYLLGALVERRGGQPLATFARTHLEAPLGIFSAQWFTSGEGIGSGAGGTRYRSRDLAKLGQLLLDEGRWQGRQVLPADWVRSMLTVHAQARDDADYGYLIWRFRFPQGDGELQAWAMAGNGGNYVFVVPARRLVTVITRSHYNQPRMHQQSHALFADHVLKAMPAAGQPARAADPACSAAASAQPAPAP